MKTTIYALTDPTSQEVKYIGVSRRLNKRFKEHLKDLSNTHKVHWIQSLLKKGFEPQLYILEEVLDIDWGFWEEYYISLYKSWGFDLTNGTPGGDGITRHSLEAKKKMSLAKLGVEPWNKGKHYSEERLKQMSKLTKSKMDDQYKDKIRQTVLKTLADKKNKGVKFKQQKSVKQIDIKSGEVIKIWDSCRDAVENLCRNKKSDGVAACARGIQTTAFGYKWEFIN